MEQGRNNSEQMLTFITVTDKMDAKFRKSPYPAKAFEYSAD